MASILNDHFEILERLPAEDGFTRAAYKARVIEAGGGDESGRIVLLRLLPPPAITPDLARIADQLIRLPIQPNLLRFEGLTELPAAEGHEAGSYLVSEYARGISLRERIRRVAPFSLAVTLDIAISTAQALTRAHGNGIMHGDLRPERIVLTPEGNVKVADFAVARAVQDALGIQAITGDDIRALGLLIYEMMTGVAPDQLDVIDEHSPRTLNASVPPALDGIVRKATSLDPQRVYTDVSQVLADLQLAREDLRANKPLAWSPLNGSAKPAARPAPPRGAGTTQASGLLTQAAEELAVENAPRGKRERARAASDDAQEEPPVAAGSSRVWNYVIAILLILLIAGIIAASAFLTTQFEVPVDVVVPNLIGKQFTGAQKTATSQHFAIVEQDHDYNDAWPAGEIYEQSPAPGRTIKAGREVNVKVSDGPHLEATPNLSGMTLARAQQALAQVDLPQGSTTYQYDDTIAKGIVISQQPTADSNVPRQTAVDIVVSKGPNPPGPPSGLSATASVEGEVDLAWDDVDTAATYNVYRDGKKIASGLPQANYSDTGLGQGEKHTYDVTAVNANGESPKSADAMATTLINNAPPDPSVVSPPVTPPSPSAPADPTGTPRQRRFEIKFDVPRHGRHNVQIEVQDTTGTSIVYDEDRDSGDTVDTTVSAFGNKVIFRIFIDGKLIRQQTQ